ncbi:MAG: DUF58 domain-containing protein [Mogibacterium sp.]|nr:DUF58 domain-containing protein [Mogibacterium sp.]
MLKRRIACGLLILAALILYFFDNETVTLALLLAIIILPAVSIGLLALSGKNLTVKMGDSPVVGDKPTMRLTIENPGIMPVANAELEVVCENLRTGETDSTVIHVSPGPKSKKEIDFEVLSGHAGRYRIHVTDALVWDPLMLAKKEARCEDSRFITVMPEIFETQLSYASDAALLENDRSAESRRGMDPGDVRGIREYVPGDPVRNIHWKLSEKIDKMLVKELGTPITDQLLVILGSAGERSSDPEALETIASVYVSLLNTLRLDSTSLTAAWTDALTGRAVFKKISDEDEMNLAADEFLASPAALQGAFSSIDRDLAETRYAHIVIVCGRVPTGLEAIANGTNVTVLLYGAEGSTTENNVQIIGFGNKTYREDLAGIEV